MQEHKKLEGRIAIDKDNKLYIMYHAPQSQNHCDFCYFHNQEEGCVYSQEAMIQHAGCGIEKSIASYYFKLHIVEVLENL